MKNLKKICVLFLFTILCSTVFAESKKAEIKVFFKEYKEMVSLAEQAAKNKSVPDMAKVEGLMTKLSVKYASLRTSDDWTEKHTKKYEKLTAQYGIAHKEFGKNVGKDIGNTAKEFGKDMGKAGKKAGKELKKLFD